MKNYSFLVCLVFLTLLPLGCKEDKDVSVLDPPKVSLNPQSVAKGKQIFNTMCIACHQEGGHGKPGLGPRLNSPDFLGLANDEFLKNTILNGRQGTGMIAYKNIPMVADAIDDVVSYIRSWQNDYATFRQYKVDWKKKISGNVTDGRRDFRTYCASCHGVNGGGYADGGSGLGIGLAGFLSVASDDYIKKTIEIGRAGTAMKPFGHGKGLATLSDHQIDGIVAYLRSLEK